MYDVVIIGAGVTGSASARELSRYKLNICVVDKEEECSKSNTKKILDLSYEDYIMEVNNFCKDAVNI